MSRKASLMPSRGPAKDLERNSSLPLYHQLAVRLEGEILSLALREGDRFHTNRGLMTRYRLSLLTVRQAVDQLVDRQLLVRRHGSGTYIGPGIAKLASEHRNDSILFSGWDSAALSGGDAMYFRDVFDGIRQDVNRRGMRLVFDDSSWKTTDDIIKAMRRLRIRGALVLVGSTNRERAELFRSSGIPVAVINEDMPGFPQVRPDDQQGAYDGVNHLASLGHRRFIHLNSGESTIHWLKVRTGYEAAIRGLELDIADHPVVESAAKCGSVMAGFDAMDSALRRQLAPTAVFAGNDLMAIGAIRRLYMAEILVPRDMSVLGFDGIDACEFCVPPLSSMEVDRRLLGARSIEVLLGQSDAAIIPVTLRNRGSLAPPPLTLVKHPASGEHDGRR
jgi:DNA-binding LacI/PurR family transcriptional regulator